MIKGIDVSRHNGVIDWSKVKGIDFAMIKAGSGFAADAKFSTNIVKARAAGIPVGVYWFAYALNTAEAVKEANACHKLISKYKIDIPTVYYDFEDDTDKNANAKKKPYTVKSRTQIIKVFCNTMIVLGHKAGVYINPNYLEYLTDGSELKQYDLWLADWVTNGFTSFNDVNGYAVTNKYGNADIWQFGKTAKFPGIGTVDINYGYFPVPNISLELGDKVKVLNTVMVAGVKRGKTYDGGTFRVYCDTYDVISAKGDRVVIGIGKAVTAAVNAKNLEKVI